MTFRADQEWKSIKLRLIWSAVGLMWLAVITRAFRHPVPQYSENPG